MFFTLFTSNPHHLHRLAVSLSLPMKRRGIRILQLPSTDMFLYSEIPTMKMLFQPCDVDKATYICQFSICAEDELMSLGLEVIGWN